MPRALAALALASVAIVALATASATGRAGRAEPAAPLPAGATAWRDTERGVIRGVTIGPIESSLHPGKGYGSPACARTMSEARRLGASWVSLTPFGRTGNLAPTGVDLTFEAPFGENRAAVKRAVAQAHAEGLRVLLVPHLWVETGDWRGEIDPGDDAAWKRWATGYRRFLLAWAKVAEESGAEMLSVGVELRSWVTTTHAPLFSDIIRDVRRAYHGLLTYGANWDDVFDTVVLGDIDVIGVNAFFPLAEKEGSGPDALLEGGKGVAERMQGLAERWRKPIVFTEIGYTTRTDPAIKPWLWPDSMTGVVVDQKAQAEAYAALLAPLVDRPWFAGFFVWRLYADPDDMSQEAEWGFSPRGKLSELVVRDAFHTRWAADGFAPLGDGLGVPRATSVGAY